MASSTCSSRLHAGVSTVHFRLPGLSSLAVLKSASWVRRPRRAPQASSVVTELPNLPPGEQYSIQALSNLSEIEAVARLRANAYYEDEHSRFVESFKKQFVSQEIESLQKRTTPVLNGVPQAECLVAVPNDSSQVVGCIDIRLPFVHTGVHPAGVPSEDVQGAYILNVVVHEDYRRQGVGKALMLAAMRRAILTWKAGTLYTHVEADNEVAVRLYTRCGFCEHSSESKFGSTMSLGRLVLLQVSAEQASTMLGL